MCFVNMDVTIGAKKHQADAAGEQMRQRSNFWSVTIDNYQTMAMTSGTGEGNKNSSREPLPNMKMMCVEFMTRFSNKKLRAAAS